jgi:hypothetical protein
MVSLPPLPLWLLPGADQLRGGTLRRLLRAQEKKPRLVGVHFGDAEALESLGIIFAVEDVPLFAALEDFLFLRRDLGADIRVNLLFELQ